MDSVSSSFNTYMKYHQDEKCIHKIYLKDCKSCLSIKEISFLFISIVGAHVVHKNGTSR